LTKAPEAVGVPLAMVKVTETSAAQIQRRRVVHTADSRADPAARDVRVQVIWALATYEILLLVATVRFLLLWYVLPSFTVSDPADQSSRNGPTFWLH